MERFASNTGGQREIKQGLGWLLFFGRWICESSILVFYLARTHTVTQRKHWGTTTCTNSFGSRVGFQKLRSLDETHMLSSLWNLFALSPLLALFFSALSISTSDKPIFALLLQTQTICRIVDFINADSEGPVVCLSLTSRIGCPHTYINAIEDFQPPGGAHTRLPLAFCVWETGFEQINKTVQRTVDKSYWILSAMLTLC